MSFDIVAASRVETEDLHPWKHALQVGAQFGLANFMLAVVGILGMFNNRPIIVGVLTLGYATLALVFATAGIFVARRHLFASAGQTVLAAAAAGLLAAAIVAILPLAMSVINLRTIFVSLDPPLFKFLTFSRPSLVEGVTAMLLLLGAGLGAAGAVLVELPGWLRRPLTGGLVASGMAGLFQELIRPVLANSSSTKPLHDLIYTYTGMKPAGAVLMFVVGAIGTVLYTMVQPAIKARIAEMPAGSRRTLRGAALAVAFVLFALFPLYAGNFVGQVFLLVGLFMLMGMGLNIEVGLAGLLDLGFVAFYAVGAYVTALLTANDAHALAQLSWWEAMPIAVLCSVIVGVLFGVPVLKVRGDYLAVATMGLGEIVRVIVLSDAAAPLLAGAKGILSIPRPNFFGLELNTPVLLFYLALASSLVAAYVAWRLEDSRLGRAWTAIRDDEDVAQALGINLINVKLLAYGLGAAFAGLAGSIFATMLGSIYPHSFQLIISINILALIIVGGMGSLPGVALGSLVLIGLPEMLREFGEYRYLFYGLAIIAVMRLKPEGLWPSAAKRREIRAEQQLKQEVDAELQREGAKA
jgi:branched-chain amino acid transport system permease protein